MTIDGSTRTVGLIGWPVTHSRSPAMHNAAFAARGLNYVYVPLPVAPGQIGWAVRGLKALGFAGANVTVPHKEAVVPYLDELSPTASAVGAANTVVVRRDGTLWGDDTDGPGFLADLRSQGIDPAGARALVLGAGGAARAVTYALAGAGASVAVANRTLARAEDLCAAVRSALPGARVEAAHLPDDLASQGPRADLIVNATSAGLARKGTPSLSALVQGHGDIGSGGPALAAQQMRDEDSRDQGEPPPWDPAVPFRAGQVVYDLVYALPGQGGSATTALLALAAAQGARTIDGLGMLVYQGALAWEQWTGQSAPVDVMEKAARDA